MLQFGPPSQKSEYCTSFIVIDTLLYGVVEQNLIPTIEIRPPHNTQNTKNASKQSLRDWAQNKENGDWKNSIYFIRCILTKEKRVNDVC
jgi:hypothetical protein